MIIAVPSTHGSRRATVMTAAAITARAGDGFSRSMCRRTTRTIARRIGNSTASASTIAPASRAMRRPGSARDCQPSSNAWPSTGAIQHHAERAPGTGNQTGIQRRGVGLEQPVIERAAPGLGDIVEQARGQGDIEIRPAQRGLQIAERGIDPLTLGQNLGSLGRIILARLGAESRKIGAQGIALLDEGLALVAIGIPQLANLLAKRQQLARIEGLSRRQSALGTLELALGLVDARMVGSEIGRFGRKRQHCADAERQRDKPTPKSRSGTGREHLSRA
ncbi:MAG: hypothetical protein R3E83_20495 [Burkholderiaceae bacterium]